MSNRTSIRMRFLPRFPARIDATNGLKIEQDSLDLVVKPDFGALTPVPSISNADNTFFWGWDQSLDMYSRISFQNLVSNIQSVIIGPTTAAMEATSPAADQLIYFNGPDSAAVTGLTAAGRALLDDANAAAQRATLELGTSATLNVGNMAGTVASGDDSRIIGASQKASNLSDLANATTARANLGLGSAATQSSGAFATAVQGGYADLFHAVMPNATTNVQGVGAPGFNGGNLFFYNAPVPFDVKPTLRVDRRADVGSGNLGETHKALWAYGTSGPNNAGFEWTITAELHNKALGSLGSENVALNATAFKEVNGIGPVGKTWGGNIHAHDTTGEVNPIYGLVGLEVNATAENGGADANRQRVGLHLALGGFAGTHVGYGMLIGARLGATIDRAIALQGATEGAGSFQIGIDFSDAAITSNAAILLKEGHRICFDGAYSGSYARSAYYATGKLRYSAAGSEVFTVADNGTIEIKDLSFVSPTTATTAAAGGAGGLPVAPNGYLTVKINGTNQKIPYYN